MEELTALSRSARRAKVAPIARRGPARADIPSGWYPDPAGRHELRYWLQGRWTEQVSDAGRRSSEAAQPAVKRIGKWSMERIPEV